MSLTAALRGFVVFLCCFSVVKSQTDWEVIYSDTEICAIKGSNVAIRCLYNYPEVINGVYTTVEKSFWFIKTEGEPVDLKEDPEYKDRVTYIRYRNYYILEIYGVRESDSAVYKSRFITNHQSGRSTGEPGVRLTVEDLQVLPVSTSGQQEDSEVQLKCFNRCYPDGWRYIWLINGEKTRSTFTQMFTYRSSISSTDRISCSWIGSNTTQSPEVYAPQTPTVSLDPPTEILEGGSVTLTCSSDANPAASYTWFKENKESPKSEEQTFTISNITAEDGGLYICVAQNQLGQRNSTVQVSVGSGSVGLAAACLIPAISLTLIFLAVLFLKIFRRRSSGPSVIRSQDEDAQVSSFYSKCDGSGGDGPTSTRPAEDETEIHYATVIFTKRQEDPLYSNIDPVKAKRRGDFHEDNEDVVYSLVAPSRNPAD